MSAPLHSHLAMIDRRTVAGFVHDPADPDRRFVVEILADGTPVAAVVADTYNSALAQTGDTDPRHGFVLALPDRLVATTRLIAARLANLDVAVGRPLDLEMDANLDPLQAPPGMIEAVSDGKVTGWVLAPAATTAVSVHARASGEEIATTVARTWVSRPIGGENRSVLGFTLKLPRVLLDGKSHEVEVRTSTGLALAGSPVRLPADT